MAPLPKQDDSDIPVVVGRRSARLSMIVPITVRGTDTSGQAFKENTWTIGVNKHGAKLATFHQLAPGDQVVIENPVLGRTAKARVMRVCEKRFTEDPYEIGVELLEAQNVWGVKFPPEDWQKSISLAAGGRSQEKVAGPAPPKRAASAAPTAAPKTSEAVSPTGTPATSSTEPAEHPEKFTQFNLAVTALSRFAEQADQAALALPKPLEEKPPGSSSATDHEAAATLEEPGIGLEEKVKMVSSLEQELENLANRLQASRAELEGLLSKAQDVREGWQSELEKAQHNLQEAGWRTLQPAFEELDRKLQKELDSASSKFVEGTRKSLQEETAAAVEAFSKDAGARLAALTGEHLSKLAPELQARQNQATEQAGEQITQAIRSATGDFTEEIRKQARETLPSLGQEMEKSLEESAGHLMTRMIESFQALAQTASRSQEESFRKSLEKMREQIQEEIKNAGARVRELWEQEAEGASRAIARRVGTAVESLALAAHEASARLQADREKFELDVQGKTEEFRKGIADLSASSLQGLQNYSEVLLGGFQNEMKEALSAFQEKSAKEVSDSLQKVSETQLEASAELLRKQADDALEMMREDLQATGKKLLEGTRKQLEDATQSAATSLARQAKALEEEFRGQLRKTLLDFEVVGARELESHLQKTQMSRREAILAELQTEVNASGDRAVTQIKSRADQVVNDASDLMYKQVGVAEVVMKDWADQAKIRLETHFLKSTEVFEKQLDELSKTALERHRKKAEVLVEGLHDRLDQAARLFQNAGPEAVVPNLLKAADALPNTPAPQNPTKAEASPAHPSNPTKDEHEQAVNEATQEFRSKINEILRGRPFARKGAAERKP